MALEFGQRGLTISRTPPQLDDAISLHDPDDWRLACHRANVCARPRPRQRHNQKLVDILPARQVCQKYKQYQRPARHGGSTKTVFIDYEGVRTHTKFYSAAIKSREHVELEHLSVRALLRKGRG